MKSSLFLLSSIGLMTAQAYANETASTVTLPTLNSSAQASLSLKTQVEQASSASKGMAQLKDIPQIVNVVPQQVLKEQNVTSLQGALQNVTGLSFSVGDGQRDQVMIRGFSAISDQYVDGVRDDALYYRDLSNVERVEVLKRARVGVIWPRFSRRPDQPDQ